MNKAYSRINWENYPSTETPLNETNLNRMDGALNTVDDRVVSFDVSKANQSDILQAIRNVSFDSLTGTFTFTFFNGTTQTVDTDIEKIPVNFDYDDDPTSLHYQQLIIYLDDGTVKYINMSALITQYEFDETATIAPTITSGRVSMNVKDGSITGAKMQPDYLADITVQAQNAQASATASAGSATLAQSWAEGGTGTRPDEDTQNAEYFAGQAQDAVAQLLQAFGVSVTGTFLIFGATFLEQFDIEVDGTTLKISNPT